MIAQLRRCYDLALTTANSDLTQNLTRTCTVQDTGLEGITDALQTGIQDCASPPTGASIIYFICLRAYFSGREAFTVSI